MGLAYNGKLNPRQPALRIAFFPLLCFLGVFSSALYVTHTSAHCSKEKPKSHVQLNCYPKSAEFTIPKSKHIICPPYRVPPCHILLLCRHLHLVSGQPHLCLPHVHAVSGPRPDLPPLHRRVLYPHLPLPRADHSLGPLWKNQQYRPCNCFFQ